MSKLLVLYNYNKYYNRIIKKLATYNDYKALITSVGNTPAQLLGFEITEANFYYADGVFAKHVINIDPKNDPIILQSDQPDYIVQEETFKQGETEVTKVSRWFVLEADRVRGCQYELTLRRDLLADYYEQVIEAPVFIEKGHVHRNLGINDPAIFNRENMTYNQIKKNELLLNFNKLSGKGGGWVVGYIAKEETPTNIGPCIGQAELPPDIPNYADLPTKLKSLITSGTGYKYNAQSVVIGLSSDFRLYGQSEVNNIIFTYEYNNGSSQAYYRSYWGAQMPNKTPYPFFINFESPEEIVQYIKSRIDGAWISYQFLSQFNTVYTSERTGIFTEDFSVYNNTYYKGTDNKYYLLKVRRTGYSRFTKKYTLAQCKAGSDALSNSYNSLIQNQILLPPSVVESPNGVSNKDAVLFGREEEVYEFISEEVDFRKIQATILAERNTLLDAPYDMFAIPLGVVRVKNSGSTLFTTKPNDALALARAIALKGGSKIYDIQVLPYCPYPEAINSDGDIDITSLNGTDATKSIDYSMVTDVNDNTVNANIVLYPQRSKGTFNIDIASNSPVYEDVIEITSSALEKKIASETKFVRFVSPNFAAMFDINVQKNKGIVNLNVDFFYKPYSPYLHVAPYFNGLYGQDYNDPKGLICSGDFSVTTTNSLWEQYQIQNKNYELIFNRQIENLDVNNKIAYEQQAISSGIGVGTSALTGAAAGAVAGSALGPIGSAVGAVVGAVGGGLSSGIGRHYDLEYLKKSQTEARSYAVDMYAYNLGNIKALPNALTKVTTLTENFKIFPFLEFYDCTEEEKEALRDKIKYNGMTIMRIGKIADFRGGENHFVSGQLIRLEGINEDSHVIAEIANEIKEGAYYYGSDTSES